MRGRWLVTGAGGQLGGHVLDLLSRELGDDGSVLGTVRLGSETLPLAVGVDLADRQSLTDLLAAHRPTHVVHLAGVTSPRQVLAEPELARVLNVNVVDALSHHARSTGAWLLFPSSDWVFDGSSRRRLSEDDPASPSSEYGRLKVEGEDAVLAAGTGLVLRLPLLCGFPVRASTRSTWGDLRRRLTSGATVQGITDEHRTPLSFHDAARSIVALGCTRVTGLLHAAGPEILTPFDVIRSLALSVGAEQRVLPADRAEVEPALERPRMVALDATRLSRLLPGLVPAAISAATFAEPLSEGARVSSRPVETRC